jgi:type IV pilus assembly protein PilV
MNSHPHFISHAALGVVHRRRVIGSVMLEALIALGVFTVAILGVMSLQAKMVASTSGAKYRADAAFLATEVVGMMWGDVANLAQYDSAQCSSYPRCNAWQAKVASYLPKGAATLTVNNGLVTMTLSWTPPNAATSAYTTSTSVRL